MTDYSGNAPGWSRSNPDTPRFTPAQRALFALLGRLEEGRLRLRDGGRWYEFGQAEGQTELVAEVCVHHRRTYREVLLGGSIAAGESFMAGHWSTPDLVAVVRLMARNLATLDQLDSDQSLWRKSVRKLWHLARRNSRDGARRNIAAHYDLGNEFFRHFLDARMMYSSAIYPEANASLEQAADHKLQRICDKLELGVDDHLLEIGTGWGGLAIFAAQHTGCRVTTTTISREQYHYAWQAVEAQGLSDRITVLCKDYRDLTGRYDKIVSVEMIEAVGPEHFDTYFATCSALLKERGLMLLQAITIPDQRYQQARQAVDFIQRYVFPGGALPSLAVINDCLRRRTDMGLLHLEDIGLHYAQTLAHWRRRFHDNLDAIGRLGYDRTFQRLWEFYLCYCEGGFRERSISNAQLVLAKPGWRPRAI